MTTPTTPAQDKPQWLHRLEAHGKIDALEGMRGLAVLLATSNHLFPLTVFAGSWLGALLATISNTTWIGVDIFFVLSGFLITGILLGQRTAPAGSYYTTFYGRRFLRIFPLYYALLLVFLVVVPRIPLFAESSYFFTGQGSTWPFWVFAMNLGVPGVATHSILFVIWSLCAEEHYYLIWPQFVRWFRPQLLVRIVVGLLIASVLVKLVYVLLHPRHDDFLYKFTFTHLEGILVGSLLRLAMHLWPGRTALWQAYSRSKWWLFAAFCGVVALAVALERPAGLPANVFDSNTMAVIGFLAIALFAGALLTSALLQDSRAVNWLFSRRLLLLLGKYSYAMYLFHMAAHFFWRVVLYTADAKLGLHLFDTLANAKTAHPAMLVVNFLITIWITYAAAWVSWRVLENPVNRLKKHFRYSAA